MDSVVNAPCSPSLSWATSSIPSISFDVSKIIDEMPTCCGT